MSLLIWALISLFPWRLVLLWMEPLRGHRATDP